MKKSIIYLSSIVLVLSSCIKQIDKTFTGQTVVEIDAAPLNSNAVGVTYPILTRTVSAGRPAATADSTLRRISRTIRLQLNLVGPHSSKDETIGYTVFNSPITSISFPATATGQTPSQAAGTLNVLDALSGTHYAALSGKATIPAGSSFGYIDISILNAGASAGQARFIGIKLDSTGTLLPSINYRQIGLVIDQR